MTRRDHTLVFLQQKRTWHEDKISGLPTERIIIPCVPVRCMYNPTVQTVEGPLVPLADSTASSGPRCWGSCRRRGGATERMFVRTELVKMFSTWEEIDGKREPRASQRGGDRRRAVLASFKQLQIDFQAKHICIRKTVLRAIRVSRGMCALNRWVIFLELSCRNFSPLNWGSWALFSLLFFSLPFHKAQKELSRFVWQI